MTRVAFQGVAGPTPRRSPAILWGRCGDDGLSSSRRCFPRVESGRAAYAMLPVENAVARRRGRRL